MAMIIGFAFGWAFSATAMIIWALVRSAKPKQIVGTEPLPKTNDVAEIIKKAFGDKGIGVKVHEVPTNAMEAIMSRSQIIIDAIHDSNVTYAPYLTFLKDKADENKRDMGAVLQGSKALIETVMTIQKLLEQPAQRERNKTSFINELRYAGERFAKTPAQKKVMESIISNVMEMYGTEQK